MGALGHNVVTIAEFDDNRFSHLWIREERGISDFLVDLFLSGV